MLRFPQRFVLSGVACALVVSLGLVAWALATGSSQAQSGMMHNCPLAGEWSIAVWDGASGTAASDALATCGAAAVDAAYALDPETGGWLRWFAASPGASNIPPLGDKQGVLALGAMAAATPTATPTSTPTPTPTEPPEGYGELPPPQELGPISAGGKARVSITNDSPEGLTFELEGPVPRSYHFESCATCIIYTFSPLFCPEKGPEQTFDLPPGEYTVTVRSDDPTVKSYRGTWDLEADQEYGYCYIIIQRIVFP